METPPTGKGRTGLAQCLGGVGVGGQHASRWGGGCPTCRAHHHRWLVPAEHALQKARVPQTVRTASRVRRGDVGKDRPRWASALVLPRLSGFGLISIDFHLVQTQGVTPAPRSAFAVRFEGDVPMSRPPASGFCLGHRFVFIWTRQSEPANPWESCHFNHSQVGTREERRLWQMRAVSCRASPRPLRPSVLASNAPVLAQASSPALISPASLLPQHCFCTPRSLLCLMSASRPEPPASRPHSRAPRPLASSVHGGGVGERAPGHRQSPVTPSGATLLCLEVPEGIRHRGGHCPSSRGRYGVQSILGVWLEFHQPHHLYLGPHIYQAASSGPAAATAVPCPSSAYCCFSSLDGPLRTSTLVPFLPAPRPALTVPAEAPRHLRPALIVSVTLNCNATTNSQSKTNPVPTSALTPGGLVPPAAHREGGPVPLSRGGGGRRPGAVPGLGPSSR